MCGIAGIAGKSLPKDDGKRIRRMKDLLSHRGPDDEGIYEDSPICLGHRRLSIIDLSPRGHQPMRADPFAVVYNGEIYNYRDLKGELEAKGLEFHSHSDTEVLLRGFQVWGEKILEKIRGMYAFAIWDADRRSLFCARDPFGKKPFYYSLQAGEFVFASEVEAVVTTLGGRPDIDWEGLAHYLLKGYFAPGKTVYRSIRTLQAGHCLEYQVATGAFREWPVFPMRFSLDDSPGTARRSQILEELDNILEGSIRKRFESDVPVGVLLSGGVDSSLVSLVASDVKNSGLSSFTITFKGTDHDESPFASRVAEMCGSQHHAIDIPMDDFPGILPRLLDVYGEPFGDDSAIPTYCLFRAIKPHLRVVLTGDGGDEVFAGYRDATLFWLRELFGRDGVGGSPVLTSLAGGLLGSKRRRLREAGYALTALTASGADLFQSLRPNGWTERWRRECMRPEAWRLTGGETVDRDDAENFRASGRTDLERYLNQRLERLTQEFLVKIDRASMAHSIEARCPMLDVDIFGWAAVLSRDILLRRGEPKSLLKDALARHTGKTFARRRKMGFTPPLEQWFRREEGARWLRDALTHKESLAYMLFPQEAIDRLISLHQKGVNQTGRLWKLLFLSEWHARYFGGGQPCPSARAERVP